jgi:polar amino acid transport system substrate-binding protein
MNQKRMSVFLLALFFCSAGWAQASLSTPIVLAGEDDWPPYSYTDKAARGQGIEPQGFSPRLIRAAFATQGMNVKFIAVPFARCMRLAQTAQVAGCFNASITDENRGDYIWHDPPMFAEELSIFGPPDREAKPVQLADLRGRRVGVTNGYTYPSALTHDPRISKFPANSDENLIDMLLSKRVDFILMNRTPGWLRIDGMPAAKGRIAYRGQLSADQFWIAFSKKSPNAQQAAETFGKGLAQMRKDGSYQAMLEDFRKQVKYR